MAQGGLAIRRPTAALLTAAVLAVGILFGVGVTAWAGHPVFGTQKMSPTSASDAKGQPAENASSGTGYASILKPALSAVVNISSSRIRYCSCN
jgi:hypothetical protein